MRMLVHQQNDLFAMSLLCRLAGDLSVDLVRRFVTVRGSEVKLPPREYDVLCVMVAHAGKGLTHHFINLGRRRGRAISFSPKRGSRAPD